MSSFAVFGRVVEGMDVVNNLVNEYATEHNVQNPPLDQR